MDETKPASPGVPARSWGPAEPAPVPARLTTGGLARAVLLAVVLLILPSLAAPAAAMPLIDPHAVTELIITRFDGPVTVISDGRPLDDPGAPRTPVAGATFEIRMVPGVDVSTVEGQRVASRLTVAEALRSAAGNPVDRGVTGPDGVLRLGGPRGTLGVGLYLVEETHAPEGVAGAAPFLVSLPMTNPESRSDWLYTVHVYPKDETVSASIEVDDETAVALGDPVTWTTRTGIPTTMDAYRVQSLLAPSARLVGRATDTVILHGRGAEPLAAGDYTSRVVEEDGRQTLEVLFTATGRERLSAARALDPAASVVISYRTRILTEGEHTTEVRLFTSSGGVDGTRAASGARAPSVESSAVATSEYSMPSLAGEATTRWGTLALTFCLEGEPDIALSGARFQVFTSRGDAAAGRNPVTIGGVREWMTDVDGLLHITGLRYSGFVNGLDRAPSDPLFRRYWVAPTSVPEEWRWADAAPIGAVVEETSETVRPTLVCIVPSGDGEPGIGTGTESPGDGPGGIESPSGGTSDGAAPGPGPVVERPGGMPFRGASLAGAGILSLLLVGGGIALLRGRRRESER